MDAQAQARVPMPRAAGGEVSAIQRTLEGRPLLGCVKVKLALVLVVGSSGPPMMVVSGAVWTVHV
jgi:hypothetical protein